MKNYLPIRFIDNELLLLDQRFLPLEEKFVINKSIEDGHQSIKDMVVRGAPCIGFTAIYSMALWVKNNINFELKHLIDAGQYLKTARPTAVNLAFEIDNCIQLVKSENLSGMAAYERLVEFGHSQIINSEKNNLQMAKFISEDIKRRSPNPRYRILTHCNTGFLACGSIGTALGVIEYMNGEGLVESVWVDETRPYLQGSRLTAYELQKLEIAHNIVVEGSASHLMRNGLVDFIVVGADRIVSNGDTANKIGTSNLSVLANYYKIPFYVVAPSSSFDLNMKSGEEIEIELRPNEEITHYRGQQIAPKGSVAYNPSFDVTDAALITAISCERGLITPPYSLNLPKVVANV